MSTTIRSLARLVNTSPEKLMAQLSEAGLIYTDPDDVLTSLDKVKLLGFLRRTTVVQRPPTVDSEILDPGSTLDELEEDDLEREAEDDGLVIENPFDPERIKVRTVSRTVDLIVRRIDHGEIDLAPEFQRRARVWDIKRKSRLIESLLLKIPLPVFYVAADEIENWAIVDGLQRTTTIYDFLQGKFALSGLEYLTRLDGKGYSELPRHIQRRIEETEFVVHVIEPGTPEAVMINIFKRINTGGVSLNGQEIRNALNKGPVREFLKELASSKEFLSATDGTVSDNRMDAQECVLRFSAFMLNDWETYQANDLDGFLNSAMKQINHLSSNARAELGSRFRASMAAAKQIFGRYAFRKIYDVSVSRRNQVSKALFETWSVNLAQLDASQIKALTARSEYLRGSFARLMREDRFFEVSVSYSTGSPQRVRARFSAIERLIKEALNAH
jgi:hypothetical protein